MQKNHREFLALEKFLKLNSSIGKETLRFHAFSYLTPQNEEGRRK